MSIPGQARVSVVVPVYNEEHSLFALVAEIRSAMARDDDPYELLFVDDGSDDGSPVRLEEIRAAQPNVRIVRFDHHRGKSAALRAGFRRARGDVVVTLDADLQNDPADVPVLLRRLRECDAVCGVRESRRDPWIRCVTSRVGNWVARRVTNAPVRDTGCCLQAYRRDYLEDLPFFEGMHRFLPTLVMMVGADVREVPVRHRTRIHGTTKYGIFDRAWPFLSGLLTVRRLQQARG